MVDFTVGALVDFTVGALVDFTVGALVDLIVGALVDLTDTSALAKTMKRAAKKKAIILFIFLFVLVICFVCFEIFCVTTLWVWSKFIDR